MDRDHIIRIVLEGKNNLSNVVRDMARDVDVQFKQMRNQWKSLDSEASRYARTMKGEVNDSVRKSGELMGALRQRADAAALGLRRLRQDAAALARESRGRTGSLGDLVGGFRQGARGAAEVRKQLREQLSLENDALETRKAQIRDFEKFKRKELFDTLEAEREATERAVREILNKKIQLDLEAAQELEGVQDKVRRQEVRAQLRADKDIVDAEARARRSEGRRRIRELKEQTAEEIRIKKAAVSPIDEAAVTNRVLNESRRAIDENASAYRRLGATAGRSLGDIGRGFLDGRRGLRALSIEGQRADSIFARLGNTFGRATRSIGTLVNLRWFILISALQLFGSLVAVIGSNLVSLASSATLAAGALGGAFAAALGQGIVTLGLFKAAAASLGEVLDAVKIQEQNRLRAGDDATEKAEGQRTAIQRLADANWTLKLALEGVTDAQNAVKDAEEDRLDAIRDQRRAVLDLAEARRDAARAIVDANLEEKDAALSLEEAELAVLEAKRKLREEESKQAADKTDLEDARLAVQEANERLRIAREEGDLVEIGSALSQLAIAEQNLGAIQNQIDEAETSLESAQNAVKRAELNQQQAAIRNKRATQDAAEARKKGVEGSDEVISARDQLRQSNEAVADATDRVAKALRGVRDAVHAVTIARREQKDAESGVTEALTAQTAAQKDLQNRLADMSPAERRLFNSIVKIKKIFEDNFGDITDIIIDAYARAVDRAAVLLEDPKILNAAKRLATAIAAAIDTISKFTLTPEFRRALITFLDEAAKNVPLLSRAFLALLRVFLRLGTAGAPLFRNLLDRFVGMVERLEKATRDPQRLDRFFAGASRHLDAWLELGKAIGGVASVLIPQAAGASVNDDIKGPPAPGKTSVPPGPGAQQQGLLPFFTEKLNDAQKFFEDNPTAAADFFDNMSKALQNLAPILGRTLEFLFKAFTSKEATAFSQVILEVVIPGLAGLVKALGLVSRGLLAIFDIPIIGDLAKFALSFLVFEKALNRIFPVSQKITNGLKALAGTIGKGLFQAVKQVSFKPLREAFEQSTKRAKTFLTGVKDLATGLKTMADRAYVAGRTLALNLIDRLKLAATAAADLSKQALNAAKQGLLALAGAARATAAAIATRLLGALRAAATLIRVGLVNAIRLLRLNIRLLLLSTGIGALIVAGVLLIEHWDKVKKFAKILADFLIKSFKRIVDWVRDNWKTLVKIIVAVFLFPVGTIAVVVLKFKDRIIGVFKSIVEAVKDMFTGMVNFIKEKIVGVGKAIVDKAKGVVSAIKGVFGGNDLKGEVEDEANDRANKILEDSAFDKARPRIKRMRAAGKKGMEILTQLLDEGVVSQEKVDKIREKQNLAVGGEVLGGAGKAVPIIAHAGEWVLNKVQQSQVLKRLNMTADEAKSWLFGGETGGKGTKPPRKGRVAQSHRGNQYTLTQQIDDDGNAVWFIEMDDGAWGQISRRSAARIKATNGAWIPPHVLRSTHGFTKIPRRTGGALKAMARGGVVQSFALGGVVQGPGMGDTVSGAAIQTRPGQTISKQVSQEFNVKAEGTMDWHYIMRLGAQRAQEV